MSSVWRLVPPCTIIWPPLVLLIKIVPLAFLALFPVINPIGTAVILLGMTGEVDRATRRLIARKIAVNTFILLCIVLMVGSYLLSFFGLTIPVVQAAGGLVLASMGWRMLHQDGSGTEQKSAPWGCEIRRAVVLSFHVSHHRRSGRHRRGFDFECAHAKTRPSWTPLAARLAPWSVLWAFV